MINRVLFILIMSLSANIYAGGFTHTLNPNLVIDTIQTHQDYLQIKVTTPITSPDNASTSCNGSTTIDILRASASFDEAVSIVLAAKLANQEVSFFITNCNGAKMNAAYVMLH
jgi:hypothetical protein